MGFPSKLAHPLSPPPSSLSLFLPPKASSFLPKPEAKLQPPQVGSSNVVAVLSEPTSDTPAHDSPFPTHLF
jgi:hypothetical protein